MALCGPGYPALAWIVERQHGRVTIRQLLACGFSRKAVRRKVEQGLLVEELRGVFTLAAPPQDLAARALAAVLAYEPHAFASHHTAAALAGLRPAEGPLHVTVVGRRPARMPVSGSASHGAAPVVHRSAGVPRDERRILQGVPATSGARALLDMAAIDPRAAIAAFHHAVPRRLVTRPQVEQLVHRHPRRHGTGVMRDRLSRPDALLTRSEAERRYLLLVRQASLPTPETNVVLDGLEVDVLWREHGVIVEIDGFAYHGSPEAFESDRRRDTHLAARDLQALRFTWSRIVERPFEVVAETAATLAARSVRRP